MPAKQLASILSVDTIVTHSIVRKEKLVAEAQAKNNFWRAKGFVGPSASTATVHLYDGKNSELLWQFEQLLTDGLGSKFDQTILNLSNRMALAFPYFNAL